MSRRPAAESEAIQIEFPLGEESAPLAVDAATVAVARPLPTPLTYAIPAAMKALIQPGLRVHVPLGRGATLGFVTACHSHFGPPLKEILAVAESEPCLTPVTLALGLWMSRHYGAAPGEALEALVPSAVRQGRSARVEWAAFLVEEKKARGLLALHADSLSWISRRRVLRTLLESADPELEAPFGLRSQELLRLAECTPSPLQTLAKAGVVRLARVPLRTDPFASIAPERTEPKPLTADQARVLPPLLSRLENRLFQAALLHGVTGSGKTEIYLRLIERCLELGRSAILLIPEIALTPQTVERIRSRVANVAVLHSQLGDADRAREWRRLKSGEVRVAVGPRSAIFAPLVDLGLVILDEEHETTFKQQQSPRYHAREVALERARLEGALAILGTATPSLETEGLVQAGGIERFTLPCRVGNRPMPKISILDMRHQKPVGKGGIFAAPLVAAIDQTLAAGEQVVLFLNRRGFATTVLCRQCGWRAQCPHCAIHLTHYRNSERLLCHYCHHESAPPTTCPECRYPNLRYGGFGTEKVAEAAAQLFPGKRISRMDGETLRARHAPEKLFRAMKDGEIDILVGTQVLAKGFDIPGIALVGVISADTALLIPDFRSAERTFQLLCQVAGRTGRGDRPGRVLIQTFIPEHYAIRAASAHDHESFAREELLHRKALGYPPFGHLVRVVVQGTDADAAKAEAERLGTEVRTWPEVIEPGIEVLGPAPCPIPILRGEHRHHLLFRANSESAITNLLPRLPRKASSRLRCLIDRDPVALM